MFDIRLSSFLGVIKIHLGRFTTALSMYILKISKFLLFGEIWTEILAKYQKAVIFKLKSFCLIL